MLLLKLRSVLCAHGMLTLLAAAAAAVPAAPSAVTGGLARD
jgi:acyl dehydratase